jgi:hypothetical protein
MRTNANAVRSHEFVSPHPDLEAVKDWAKRAFPKDRIPEPGVVTATLVLAGYLGAVVYQVLNSFTLVGL